MHKKLAAGCGAGFVPQLAEKEDSLVDFLSQCCGVVVPGEVLADVHSQEHRAALPKTTLTSLVFCTFRER